jgi:hypothetical protein
VRYGVSKAHLSLLAGEIMLVSGREKVGHIQPDGNAYVETGLDRDAKEGNNLANDLFSAKEVLRTALHHTKNRLRNISASEFLKSVDILRNIQAWNITMK